MKIKIAFLSLGIIIGAFIAYVILNEDSTENSTVFQDFTSFGSLDTQNSISCTYPQMLSTYYKDNHLEHSLPSPETNPMVFTFSDFNQPEQGIAKLSYMDASQSISSVAVGILYDDADKIVMLENGGEDYVTTHTIFKKQGVAIFSKQILFPSLNIPSGTMAMGTCR